jgi:hypothetical protein
MFLRQTRRKKDDKTHSYWSVGENHRLGTGRVVQRHVLYLGEISPSQAAAWRKSIEVFDEDTSTSRWRSELSWGHVMPPGAPFHGRPNLVARCTSRFALAVRRHRPSIRRSRGCQVRDSQHGEARGPPRATETSRFNRQSAAGHLSVVPRGNSAAGQWEYCSCGDRFVVARHVPGVKRVPL